MRKAIYFNEDLNGQPFRHLASFLAVYLWTNKLHSYSSRDTLDYRGLLCESHSPRGHFSSSEELTRRAGEWQDPKVARGIWEETDGTAVREEHKGRSIHSREVPIHITCPAGISFPATCGTPLHVPATSYLQGSGAHQHPGQAIT